MYRGGGGVGIEETFPGIAVACSDSGSGSGGVQWTRSWYYRGEGVAVTRGWINSEAACLVYGVYLRVCLYIINIYTFTRE